MKPLTEEEIQKFKDVAKDIIPRLSAHRDGVLSSLSILRTSTVTPKMVSDCERLEEKACMLYNALIFYTRIENGNFSTKALDKPEVIEYIRFVLNGKEKK